MTGEYKGPSQMDGPQEASSILPTTVTQMPGVLAKRL